MSRRKRTALQRAAIFEAHGGRCHICGGKIGVGEAWQLDHIVAYNLTRDDSDENLSPAHVKCHREKTRQDTADAAKAKRVSAKHKGAHRHRARRGIPYRKFDGSAVWPE